MCLLPSCNLLGALAWPSQAGQPKSPISPDKPLSDSCNRRHVLELHGESEASALLERAFSNNDSSAP